MNPLLTRGKFQFHKGAIRTVLPCWNRLDLICFNSIKVQLEPMLNTQTHRCVVFQFHKGAIRTEVLNYVQ